MQIIMTPTVDWLGTQARACSFRMLICSSFVNEGILEITDMVPPNASRTLVTRTDLRDFAVGASNLDTLCSLSSDGVSILSLNTLHAKVYIFDDAVALVTSANATHAGMKRNLECGLTTTDARVVRGLAKSLIKRTGEENRPVKMSLKDLEALYGHLDQIEVSVANRRRHGGHSAPSAGPIFSISNKEALLRGFTGWLRLTLDGVLRMPPEGFRMDDLLKACGSTAERRYPRNRHISEKLRQQLQILRDRGLVDFVSPGYYRPTMMVDVS